MNKIDKLKIELIELIEEALPIYLSYSHDPKILKIFIDTYKNEIIKLKNEIKDLNETIDLMKKNATPRTTSQNARGAGRKPKITEKEIAEIQKMRAQGKTLQEIQSITGISYGNVQKYSKLITDNNKKRAGS